MEEAELRKKAAEEAVAQYHLVNGYVEAAARDPARDRYNVHYSLMIRDEKNAVSLQISKASFIRKINRLKEICKFKEKDVLNFEIDRDLSEDERECVPHLYTACLFSTLRVP